MTTNDLGPKTLGPKEVGIDSLKKSYQTLLEGEHCLLLSEKWSELSWLRRAREKAAETWQKDGFPTRNQERWKYTNLSTLESVRLKVAEASPRKVEEIDIPAVVESGSAATKIVFVNGYFSAELSRLNQQVGLSITVLSQLIGDCVANGWSSENLHKLKSFRKHVEESDAARETSFSAMNMSFFHDGVLLETHPGAVIHEPIIIYHFTDMDTGGSPDGISMASPRVFVDLKDNSQAVVLECFAPSKSVVENRVGYFNNAVCDLRLARGSRISHARWQVEADSGIQIAATRVHQEKDSFCETYQFSLGGELARHDLHISLEGTGAEAILDGLYYSNGRRQADNFTFVEHISPQTTSAQLYKGILDDESRAVFHGRVRIHPDAQKSNAAQLNKNLLLSPRAEVDTRPELAIDADDVKAAHGATIGRLDAEQVFYLQTRAISKVDAERMLSYAFAAEVAMRIQNPTLRSILTDALADKLGEQQLGRQL